MSSILLKNICIADENKDVLIGGSRILKIQAAGSCIDWDLAGDVEVMDCTGQVARFHQHAYPCRNGPDARNR